MLLEGNTVVNVIVWDGDPWSPPADQTLMRVPEDVPQISVGWALVDGEWVAPQYPDPVPLDEV